MANVIIQTLTIWAAGTLLLFAFLLVYRLNNNYQSGDYFWLAIAAIKFPFVMVKHFVFWLIA